MNSLTKFAMGSAMGFMIGAGMMMMPVGNQVRRDVKHKAAWVRKAFVKAARPL